MDDDMDYEVTCARCGKVGSSADFMIEEGDEWECPKCWERCEAASQSDRPVLRNHTIECNIHDNPIAFCNCGFTNDAKVK